MAKRKRFVSVVDDPQIVKQVADILKLPVTEPLSAEQLSAVMAYCSLENVSISNAIGEIAPKFARSHSTISLYRRGSAIPLVVCNAVRRILLDTIRVRSATAAQLEALLDDSAVADLE